MTTMYDFALTIKKITPRENANGGWVDGTIDQRYRFQALVFAEHAESEEYELGRSRVSKWSRRPSRYRTLLKATRGVQHALGQFGEMPWSRSSPA